MRGQVEAFRTRPLGDAGPFTFVAADALTMGGAAPRFIESIPSTACT